MQIVSFYSSVISSLSEYTTGRMPIPANDNVVGNPLVVCTAHIHWDPEFCDVKLVQTMMLAHEVSRMLEDVSIRYKLTQQQVPVLICGDLNSLPDSGVFEYLSKGQITRKHLELKSFKDDICLERFTNSTDKNVISHPLRLDSACDTTAIPFTNYTLDFKGMIDYIFATPQSLARLGILGPFDTTWIKDNKILGEFLSLLNAWRIICFPGFPHPHVASDHIPIMAQYAIIPTTHQRQPPPPQAQGHTPAGVIGAGYPAAPLQNSFLRWSSPIRVQHLSPPTLHSPPPFSSIHSVAYLRPYTHSSSTTFVDSFPKN